MTLRYKLFGIPGNIDEVVDKAEHKGIIPEVYVQRRNEGTLVPGAARYSYSVGVRVGRTSLELDRWEISLNDFVCGIDDYKLAPSDGFAYEAACQVAVDLNSKGLSVMLEDEIYVRTKLIEPGKPALPAHTS